MKRKSGVTDKALLGLLSIHPMSGYDLRQLISWSIGHFWSESYGQIYPALNGMTAAGLVVRKTERQKGRPARHVYSLTKNGREALKEWLGVAPEAGVPRNELLLKLFYGTHAPKGTNREHVTEFLVRQEEALKIYATTEKRLKKEAARDPQLPFWLMTLSYGRHESKAHVKWARETLKELDRLERAR
jgi:PadR family transcriptional regulator, regulatory protein AphA